MKNTTRRFSQLFLSVFAREDLRLIGGTTGPQTTHGDALEALRQRRGLQSRAIRNPHVHFTLFREVHESDLTDDEWLQVGMRVMERIGAADALWWAFVNIGWGGRYELNIYALLTDSTGKPVATGRYKLGRLNADGSKRVWVPDAIRSTLDVPYGVN